VEQSVREDSNHLTIINSPHYMEPEGSLPFSQELSTDPYTEPD
jgi:hypothetical protein